MRTPRPHGSPPGGPPRPSILASTLRTSRGHRATQLPATRGHRAAPFAPFEASTLVTPRRPDLARSPSETPLRVRRSSSRRLASLLGSEVALVVRGTGKRTTTGTPRAPEGVERRDGGGGDGLEATEEVVLSVLWSCLGHTRWSRGERQGGG